MRRSRQKIQARPIAYGNGRTGEVIHIDCWGDYVDARRSFDAQGKPMAWGCIGTLYYSHANIKSHKCAHCGKEFTRKEAEDYQL